MEAAWLDAATSQGSVQTALRLSTAAGLCTAALGVSWLALHARPVLNWAQSRSPWEPAQSRGSAVLLAVPELQRMQPLALTLPALLVSLCHDAAFLGNFGRSAPAPLTPGMQGATLMYLMAAALLYYRPLRGAWSWVWAGALCMAPILMAAQVLTAAQVLATTQATPVAGGWSGVGSQGESVVCAVAICGLCLAAWWAALLMHRPMPGTGVQDS